MPEEQKSQYPLLPPPFHHTLPPPTLVTQGAEGHLFMTTFLDAGMAAALKVRPAKSYRHKILDQRLTKQRVLAEARILVKLSNAGIAVPSVHALDWHTEGKGGASGTGIESFGAVPRTEGAAWLLMQWIDGTNVKQLLQACDRLEKAGVALPDSANEEAMRGLLRRIGRAVAAMHSIGGVVHGDLTSSNIIVQPSPGSRCVNGRTDQSFDDPILSLRGQVVLIDFGLAIQSIQDEDRAVDLYVLERAFGSTHPAQERMFAEEVLESPEGYRGSFNDGKVVLKKLEEVRLRGRKRTMVG